MNADQLRQVMPHAGQRALLFADPLSRAMTEFGITNARRQAAFLAQVAQESGELVYLKELGTDEEHEKAYGGRQDLGNVDPGDGARYPGRGLFDITGKVNYQHCGIALNLPLIQHPELLEEPDGACRSAGWFWSTHGLSELSDHDAFGSICHRVNGGYNGLDERIRYYLTARSVLGV